MLAAVFWISSVLIIYTYLIYPAILLFFRRVTFRRKIGHGDYFPFVSVIISAHNEEKVIGDKLENCLKTDYPKDRIEILVGSDGSTDKTESIIEEYINKRTRLFKFKPQRGKVNVLNELVGRAKGEIIVFSDANTIYKSDAIPKLVHKFADKKIGCVCGELIFTNSRQREVGNLEGFYWRYEQFLKKIEGMRGSLLGANGGIYAIRKELFKALAPDAIIEDFIIPMKILEKGYKVVYEPEAVAYEEASKKIVQEMERRIRIGAGDFQALFLTWKMLNPLRGFSAFAYISHKVIRWLVPFFLIFAFTTNLVLLENKLYLIIFLLQCVFYSMAIIGRILSRSNLKFILFGLPYYFISMNLALFFGFIRFCTNSQSVMWRRTER